MRAPLLMLALAACGGNISDEDAAELAYVGLDDAVERAMNLGFDGFNAADSANIDDQVDDGEISGTMTVGGQVDQGASDNKGMRLTVVLVDYADVVLIDERDPDDEEDDRELEVTYDSLDPAPELDLSLRDIPDGTLTGSFVGSFELTGDLEGDVALDLEISANIEEIPDQAGKTRRVAGSTRVTGTAESAWGTFDVDVTR